MSAQGPGPGWFDDPGGSGQQRFWDGKRWTDALSSDQDGSSSVLTQAQASHAGAPKAGGRAAWMVAGGLIVVGLLAGSLWWFVEGRRPSDSLVEVGVEQHVPPADEAVIYSVSPDGRTVLVSETEPGDGRVCMRSIDELARACVDAPGWMHARAISWSGDGLHAVLGDDLFHFRQGGDVIVIDVEAGTAASVVDAVEMTPETINDGSVRAYYRPTLSPDGRQVVAFRLLSEGQFDVVVIDVETGEERLLVAAPEGFVSLLWSPDGDTIWVNGFRLGEQGSYSLAVSVSGDIDLELDTTVELAHVGPPYSQLVQISADGQIGLLLLSQALGSRGLVVNFPYFAIVDLDTGRIAPVLPAGPDDPDAVDYARLHGGRLSADSRFVTLVHGTTAHPTDPDADVRLVRIPVESIFDNTYERQMVIDGVGQRLGLELPLNPATDTQFLAAHPLPADGDALSVPLWLHTPDSRAGSSPDLFVVIRGDRPW